MFKIGYRTLKTAVGATIAVAIAQALQLDFFASAGILTILCVQKTRRRSIHDSWERFLACVIGMVFAIVIFEIIGYHALSIGILLLLFIPTTLVLKVQGGIVTSAVIMFHIYTVANLSMSLVMNELALIIIGIGMALLMNSYMPSQENRLEDFQKQIEDNYAKIFYEFAYYVRYGDNNWDGKEITKSAELLKEAKNNALQNLENHILRYEDVYYHYFKMREKQLDIMERMMPLLTTIDHHVSQADMLADFMEELSGGVHPENTAHIFIDKLDSLKESYKNMALPQTREEFETRSALVHLVRELEQYLDIKQQFKPTKEYKVFR
ncbi:aromatic acid exporter family protein [Salipaludibacillus daqingensis]|uniref:aromatic acid exporter family protein n=1 Tax=Salipaludibacillus daqingensis TaxID=3041001 RepID=UPI002476B3B4|nr:aromatic acid exporter family protein [Salipaludibacillus daqingensis]